MFCFLISSSRFFNVFINFLKAVLSLLVITWPRAYYRSSLACVVKHCLNFLFRVLATVLGYFNKNLLGAFQACAFFKWTRDLAEAISSGITTTPSPRGARISNMEAAKGMPITSRVIRSATRHATKFPVSSLTRELLEVGIRQHVYNIITILPSTCDCDFYDIALTCIAVYSHFQQPSMSSKWNFVKISFVQ